VVVSISTIESDVNVSVNNEYKDFPVYDPNVGDDSPNRYWGAILIEAMASEVVRGFRIEKAVNGGKQVIWDQTTKADWDAASTERGVIVPGTDFLLALDTDQNGVSEPIDTKMHVMQGWTLDANGNMVGGRFKDKALDFKLDVTTGGTVEMTLVSYGGL
jgi:hypothetical protein